MDGSYSDQPGRESGECPTGNAACRSTVATTFRGSHLVFSQLYRTPAVGGPSGQSDFYNAVAMIDSNLSAFEVWGFYMTSNKRSAGLAGIDGRLEPLIWTSCYMMGNVIGRYLQSAASSDGDANFVLEPACEIAEDWIEPVTGQTVRALADALPHRGSITRFELVDPDCRFSESYS